MTTVPGTYFTKEQLEAAQKADDVSGDGFTGSDEMVQFGYVYKNDKNQYDKALAWYILAVIENSPYARSNIGTLYHTGHGVPKNYLCSMKWYLKADEGNSGSNTLSNIGQLFENGYGVPLDKYKALEWYCHGGIKPYIKSLKDQGYHRSTADKRKPLEQLRKETEAILDAEKKKLEQKQNKTQEEMEALVDLNITYKLVDGGKEAWKDVPILSADDKQRYTNPGEKQAKKTIKSQARQLESVKQKKTKFKLPPLRNDKQSLQRGDSTVQHQMKAKDTKINSLQSENQQLKLKIISLQTENQSLKHETDECDKRVEGRDNKINLLESEKREYHASSVQQTQAINSLKQEKQTIEQDKRNTTIEMELLKASNTTLEQLLKSKEDVILSLNRENQMLSTVNQGNQQGANTMTETFQNLLQGKTNEIELLKQNMEHLLANERRRNDALELEIRSLKQERAHQQATVQNTGPSNNDINSTNSNPSHHDQHDGSYNDINYESEYSDTEESDGDDINYDTPSEDEDSNNDLNYDDINESNK